MVAIGQDEEEEHEQWDIEFCTRHGKCVSIALERLVDRLPDKAAALVLSAIEGYAYPPRDPEFLCTIIADVLEVYAQVFVGLRGIAVLLAAHRTREKIYVLGVEDIEGQGHFALCEKAGQEAIRLLSDTTAE